MSLSPLAFNLILAGFSLVAVSVGLYLGVRK